MFIREELNNLIKSLQYHIQHESIPLNEEKQILREIKVLEGTRGKVIANAAEMAKIQDSLGEKEVIQDQLIGVDLDGVWKEQQVVKAKLKQLDEEKESQEKEINALQEELTSVAEERDKTFANIQEMRKQREEKIRMARIVIHFQNSSYYQNRTLLIKAKELAAKKDVEALKELSETEVEKFMSLWSTNKAFRDDYERRTLPSYDIRQLSRDGRIWNPDEKPLVSLDAPTPSQTELVVKTNERENRVKNKARTAVAAHDSEESTEAVAAVAEQENIEEKVETLVPLKNEDRKENTIRHRTRPKCPDSLQKVVLKLLGMGCFWWFLYFWQLGIAIFFKMLKKFTNER
ncbi:unnamed protein product [Fraxinus pennsylvanica]|uniref:Proton pump-interactor 1 n=1 Tax=Fraxinus pennsylvanica TaxID=56036 RepID=A0AAD2E3E3_9LAMI|nr:unnamed protein product [Fraxinus pennsylvanica]